MEIREIKFKFEDTGDSGIVDIILLDGQEINMDGIERLKAIANEIFHLGVENIFILRK